MHNEWCKKTEPVKIFTGSFSFIASNFNIESN
jgi:hypothetical protein